MLTMRSLCYDIINLYRSGIYDSSIKKFLDNEYTVEEIIYQYNRDSL